MAGMLPGVEAARRRRVHQQSSSCSSPSSRRCCFSLLSTNSSPSLLGETRSRTHEDVENWKLEPLAREAKVRLDHKLRAPTIIKPRNNSEFSQERMNANNNNNNVRNEVFGTRKKSFKIGWAKLRWKSGEQQECAVCLDEFKMGQSLLNLPCNHRFHSNCLLPWLNTNSHCPCCRISIF